VAQGYPPRRPPGGPGGPGRHGYPEQPEDPGPGGYPGSQQARGAAGSGGRHGYREEAPYREEPGYPDEPGYRGDPAGPAGYGYAGDPGRAADRAYPPAPAYAPQPAYRPERGYPADPGEPAPRSHPDDRRRPGREPRAPRQRRDAFEDDDDIVPWAGPGIYPVGPGQRARRPPPERPDQESPDADGQPPDGRLADTGRGRRAIAARARKSRRRLVIGGGAVVVAVVIVLAILGKLPFEGGPAPAPNDGLVTTYQPGEFRTVPDACHVITTTTLSQYLPGRVAEVSQALGSATQSQCTWTLDVRPNFRVLAVSVQAFAPSPLSSGDGSATFGAIDAYKAQLQTLTNPPKSSKTPKAQIGGAVGLGSSAFTGLQVFHLSGAVNDEVTVVVRDHNVIIVVTMQAQESGGGFGPVPDATLRAAALTAAHQVLTGLR
jgi:hypothetical protein